MPDSPENWKLPTKSARRKLAQAPHKPVFGRWPTIHARRLEWRALMAPTSSVFPEAQQGTYFAFSASAP